MLHFNSWFFLSVAILFGVLGTISLKLSEGLQRLKPSICLALFYSISFVALTLALQSIDISIVYAVWSGIGTLLVAVIGVVVFKESVSVKKVVSLFLIIVGVLGIHLANVFH
jgi:small multidrug resistance pump